MVSEPNTWSSVYRKHLRAGEDHGSAAYAADQWERRHKPTTTRPDKAAVWDYEKFIRALLEAGTHPTAGGLADHYFGFPVVVDETLAPGTVELRSGKEVVRIINLKT